MLYVSYILTNSQQRKRASAVSTTFHYNNARAREPRSDAESDSIPFRRAGPGSPVQRPEPAVRIAEALGLPLPHKAHNLNPQLLGEDFQVR